MHELTRDLLRLNDKRPDRAIEVDEIITSYLRGKAEELEEELSTLDARRILGLEPEGATENPPAGQGYGAPTSVKPVEDVEIFMRKKEPQPVSGEWCEHIEWLNLNDEIRKPGYYGKEMDGVDFFTCKNFQFCPICAAPRPAQRRELWEVLREAVRNSKDWNINKTYQIEASAALAWMIERVKAQPVCQVPFLSEAKIDRDALLNELKILGDEK